MTNQQWADIISHRRRTLAGLTDEQRSAVRGAVGEWIAIAKREGYEPIASWANAEAEVWHSALLTRLFDGKEPTKCRPPLAYSYPDYQRAVRIDLARALTGSGIEQVTP